MGGLGLGGGEPLLIEPPGFHLGEAPGGQITHGGTAPNPTSPNTGIGREEPCTCRGPKIAQRSPGLAEPGWARDSIRCPNPTVWPIAV